MEIERLIGSEENSLKSSEQVPKIIKVRAIMKCPSCSFRKAFKNQFPRKDIELMTVALKVFDWLTCVKCGELLNLDLEFEI